MYAMALNEPFAAEYRRVAFSKDKHILAAYNISGNRKGNLILTPARPTTIHLRKSARDNIARSGSVGTCISVP
jgi:hypothetical protein